MEIKELTTIEEMLSQLETIQLLYPKMTSERYQSFLEDMLPANYKQAAVFENEKCIALTGFWIGTKLWTGKYIEIDNFIVHPDYRKKGVGQQLTDYIAKKATQLHRNSIEKRNSTFEYLDKFVKNKMILFQFNKKLVHE